MVVKYQVERRPVGPDGTIYYGKDKGNGVAVMSNPSHASLGGPTKRFSVIKAMGRGNGAHAQYIPMGGTTIPPLVNTSSSEQFTHIVEQEGEPWLIFSTHFSIDAAIGAAAPLASALGTANVRIVKVLNHGMEYKLI